MHTGGSADSRVSISVARKASRQKEQSGPTFASRAAALLLLGVSFAALSSSAALAASDTWNGGTDTKWSTGGNWSPGVPGAGDTVVINQSGTTAPSTYDISQTYGSVTFQTGVTLNNSGTNTFGISSGGFITDSATSAVAFDSNTPVTLNGTGATINVTAGSLTFGGGLTGTGSLTLNNSVGNGALVFLGTTNITGTTTIATGSLQLGDGTNNGVTTGAIAISTGATLAFNEGSNATEAGNITGNGQVTVSGSHTVTLTGTTNSWSGGTTINSGSTLQIGSDTLQGSISASGPVTLSGGTLDFHNLVSSVFDYAGVISGSGNVSIDTGTIVYTNVNTYQGTTTIASGATLQIGQGAVGGIAQNSIIVNNGSLDFVNFGSTATLSGGISGTGQLVLNAGSATDTLILTGTNTYASGSQTLPDTVITQGILQVGNITTHSTGSIAGNVYASSNGTLDFNDIDSANNTFAGNVEGLGTLQIDNGTVILTNNVNTIANTVINGGATLQIGNGLVNVVGTTNEIGSLLSTQIVDNGTLAFDTPSGKTYLVSGAISGSGGINQTGPGITTLEGAETFTGNSTVQTGTLEFGTGATFAGAVGQTFTVSTGANLEFNTSSNFTFGDQITGAGNVSVGNGTVVLTNTNDDYSGTTAIAGTLQIGNSTTAGAVTGTSGVTIATGGILDFVNPSSSTFSAPISGAGSVTVDMASGSIALSGSNSYTGGTNIEGGTLQVSDPTNLGTGSVNFTNGATLQVTATSVNNFTQTATLGTGGGTIDTDGQVVTWSGVISDATSPANTHGSLTVTDSTAPNSGTLVLIGADTYTGGTTITSNGTLQIGNETGVGSITGTIADNGFLNFDYGGNTSFAGVISGTGQVSQDDTKGGTLTLTGANTYSGPTNIIAGTLAISSDGNLGNNGTTNYVSIDNLATLETTATNTFAHEVMLSGSGTIEVKSGTTATWSGQLVDGTLPGTLDVTGGGTLFLDNTSATPNSYSNGTVVTGNSTLKIDTDAELGGSSGNLTLGDAHSGGTLEVTQTGSLGAGRSVTLGAGGGTVQSDTGVTFEIAQGIGGTGPLNVAGPGTFVLAGTSSYTGNTNIATGSTLQLGDGTATGNIASTSIVNDNGTLDFNEAGIATTFANTIQGSGGLTQDDTSATPGTLTLTGADSYTGTTTITSGTLQLGDGTTAGTVTSNITDNAALVFDEPGTNSTTYGGVISGGGTVEVSGTSPIILTGINTYTGTTTIDSGATLQVGNGGPSGSIADSASIVDNGTLTIDTNGTTLLTGAISGSAGQLMQIGSGTTILTGNDIYGGKTTVSAGTLQIGGGTASTSGTLASNIANSGNVVFSRADSSTYAGVISGSGTVTVANGASGTTIFTGNNTYTGTTTVSSGTLQIGNGGTSGALAGNVTVGSNGNLAFNRSDTSTYGGVISGQGTVTVTDGTNGVTVLTGNNTYTGTTTVSSGTLQVGGGTASTSGSLTSSVALANNSNLTFSRSDTSTYGGAITGTGTVTVADGASGVTVLTGDSSYSGPTTIASGTLQLGSASAAGSITGNVTDNGTLAFDRSNSYTFAGVISGTGGVTQEGNGQTTLTATETYSGATAVNGGTLIVNGAITSPNGVTVGSGGTLAGTGSVTALTVKSNGTVTTGSGGIGTLTVNGSFVLGAGGTYAAQVTPTASDLLNVNGTASLNGALTVTPTGTGFSTSPVTILQASNGITGTFSNVTIFGNLTQIPIVSYTNDDVLLTFAPSVTSLLPSSSANTNQSRVGEAIDFALSHDNAIAFLPVTSETGASLTQTLSELSGETAVAFQNVAVSSVGSFMSTLFDPSVGGRGGLGAGIDGISDNHAMQQVAFNGADSDMPLTHSSMRAVTVWTEFYGYQNTTDGDMSLGTHKTTATQFGGTVGLDYRPKKGDGAIGIAFGMTGNSWDLAEQLGKGQATAYQVGTYYSRRFWDTYITAGLSYARYSTSTDRTVNLGGANLYHADFVSNSVAARAEAGHVFHTDIGRITPYANFQGDDIGVPHYAEQTQAGSTAYALSYTGKQHYDYTSEAGVAWNALIDRLTDIHARAGWLHDYAGGLSDTATFSAFNGASFLVDGASPPRDAAHVQLGLSHTETNIVLSLNGEAAIAGNATSYGGTASISYHW